MCQRSYLHAERFMKVELVTQNSRVTSNKDPLLTKVGPVLRSHPCLEIEFAQGDFGLGSEPLNKCGGYPASGKDRPMKLTIIALSSVLTLGSGHAFAQAAGPGDAATAGGATGGPAGAGSSSAVKSDTTVPGGSRDSAPSPGSGDTSAAAAGGATGGPAGAGSSSAVKSDTTGSSREPARR
jgi:hypothetical protein